MSPKTKKYLITTEKHEFFVIRGKQDKVTIGFCPICQAEVELQTLDLITNQTGKSTRKLIELIEDNAVHTIEIETGHLMICLVSLKEIYPKK